MKRILILSITLVALFATTSCGSKSKTSIHGIADIDHAEGEYDEWYQDDDIYGGDEVYVCTGGSSKKYHHTLDCKGLKGCSKEVRAVDQHFAEDKGRTPCKICYK